MTPTTTTQISTNPFILQIFNKNLYNLRVESQPGLLLDISQGQLWRPVALTHSGGDTVTDVAVQPDRLPILCQMVAVVAAETAGKILVLVVVDKTLPGDAWLLKNQSRDEFPG